MCGNSEFSTSDILTGPVLSSLCDLFFLLCLLFSFFLFDFFTQKCGMVYRKQLKRPLEREKEKQFIKIVNKFKYTYSSSNITYHFAVLHC